MLMNFDIALGVIKHTYKRKVPPTLIAIIVSKCSMQALWLTFSDAKELCCTFSFGMVPTLHSLSL